MGASRGNFLMLHRASQYRVRSYSLWMDLKFKNYKRFKRNLLILFYLKRDAWSDRKLIIKDSFTTPFYKSIGCKITAHDWHKDSEEDYYVCLKCHKWQSSQERKVSNRDKILDKILK